MHSRRRSFKVVLARRPKPRETRRDLPPELPPKHRGPVNELEVDSARERRRTPSVAAKCAVARSAPPAAQRRPPPRGAVEAVRGGMSVPDDRSRSSSLSGGVGRYRDVQRPSASEPGTSRAAFAVDFDRAANTLRPVGVDDTVEGHSERTRTFRHVRSARARGNARPPHNPQANGDPTVVSRVLQPRTSRTLFHVC